MRRPEVTKEVQRRLRRLNIPAHVASIEQKSAYVEVQVLIRNQALTLKLRSGITPGELDSELWKLERSWEMADKKQIDIEDVL